MRKKVTVVGSGFVGSTTAQRIVDADLADVVITDILDGVRANHQDGFARDRDFHQYRRLQRDREQ
jgi:malate/lactate dehydrogenase